jgi:hypothetical protein
MYVYLKQCSPILLFYLQTFDELLDIFENKTGLSFYYNYLISKQPADFENYPKYLQKAGVRRAIHVGNLTYEGVSMAVHKHLNDDMCKSVRPWLEVLLEHYKVGGKAHSARGLNRDQKVQKNIKYPKNLFFKIL